MRPRPSNPALVFAALAALLLIAIAARLLIGGLSQSSADNQLLLELRSLRVGSAALVGASLALSGALLQGLLRNPLASPDLLGMASGAGLGVMIAIYLGFLAGAGLADPGSLGSTGAAILGACATLLLVYFASRASTRQSANTRALDTTSLVLMGVIIAIICSGAMTLLKHLLPDQGVAANRLLVGAIRDDVRPLHLWIVAAILALGLAASLSRARAMDIASLSDDEATSLGVNLQRLRLTQFLVAGALTGGSVVLAGPIGFVGLLCPHLIRAWLGPRHAPLLIGSAVLGASTLIAADALIAGIRELNPGLGRLPLGALTALIGGPIFLVMLRRNEPRA